jgi:hypothetical protein
LVLFLNTLMDMQVGRVLNRMNKHLYLDQHLRLQQDMRLSNLPNFLLLLSFHHRLPVAMLLYKNRD